jgi:hypothetical protein
MGDIKMRHAIICVLSLATFSVVPSLYSQSPQLINYQGQLKQNNQPASGNFSMTFNIYSSVTGGTALWSETQTVTVTNGVFNVLLGSVNPFPSNLFTQSGTRFLGVQVGSGSEMSPRFRFTSVAYALNAATVDAVDTDKIVPNIVSSIDGVSNDGGNIDLVAGSNVTITPDDANNRITISATSSNGVGDDLGNHTATQNLNLNGNWLSGDGGNEGLQVSSAGNVGIGTTTPGFPLSFPNTIGDKISLWGQSGAHYGLGVQSTLLQIYTDIADGDIAFGYGSSASFTETMRVKGNGNVGIGTISPGQKLTVAGTIESTLGGFKFPDGSVQTTAGGGSVDNLGNHTATANLNLNGHWLSGNGQDQGIFLDSFGNVQVGTPTANIGLASSGIRFPDGYEQTEAFSLGKNYSYSVDGDVLRITHEAGGNILDLRSNSISNNTEAVQVIHYGTGGAAEFEIQNANSGADALYAYTNGTGDAAFFRVNNAGGGHALQLSSNSNNDALRVEMTGNDDAGYFEILNTSSPYSAIHAKTNGTGYAGRFAGKVTISDNLEVGGAKNFLIDHPLDPANKILRHSAVESPEMMNIYKGRARLNNGEAVISLPSYFDALNHPEGREISLTPVNGWSPLYLEGEIKNNQFVVKTTKDGNPDQEFSWVVYAVRNDAYAKDHPIVVEEEKGVNNGFKKGELLYSPGANNN